MTSLARQELDVPAPTKDPRGERALRVLNTLLASYGPRDYAIRLWDGTVQPAEPGKPTHFTLVLNRPDVLWRMFAPPNERAIGEAYAYGDFEVEGDIMKMLDLVEHIVKKLKISSVLPLLGDLWGMRTGAAEAVLPDADVHVRGILHSKDRDRAAIKHHYDISRDFYALWLDKRMVYSCSYFPTGEETLDQSQERKLEHICRKLRLQPGERYLDLGCGYGGLVRYAAKNFGVKALGITLSQEHGRLAQERIKEEGLEGQCEVRVMDYRELSSSEPFDKISAIGIIEHVGEKRLNEFFPRVYNLLKPGSLFLNHGICKSRAIPRHKRIYSRLPWVQKNFILKYVFPDLDLLPLHVLLRASAKAGFEAWDIENLRPHYAQTLRMWLDGLNNNWDAAVKEVGLPTARVWRVYLAHSIHAFETGLVNLIHTLYVKPAPGGGAHIPRTRADLYR
jgi:cyclopropane-fatty-acyl-phospholipid synthase